MSAIRCTSAAPGLEDNIYYYIVRTRTIWARTIEARTRPNPNPTGWTKKIIPNKIDYGNRW